MGTSDYVYGDSIISQDELENADREVQREVMETWFRERFEDPANSTPYDSGEGGYIWIWGGPFEAEEVLEGEFLDVVPEDVIKELAEELSGECWDWAPIPKDSDYDDYLIDDIVKGTQFHSVFLEGIDNIRELAEAKLPVPLKGQLLLMLYAQVITVLETYLCEAFVSTVFGDPGLLKRFVETTPEFKNEKLSLSEAYSAAETAERRSRTYLSDVVWHNLNRVKPMYLDTLGIEFPKGLSPLFGAILKRHDIVHRSGKTKAGELVSTSIEELESLIVMVINLVSDIDEKVKGCGKQDFESEEF